MNRILTDTSVKATKRYQCWFCAQRIEIGDIYDKRVGANGNGIWTMRMHPECNAWSAEHWTDEDYETHEPGEFIRPITAFDPSI